MKVLAPGKIILSGEHAVVHGRPALAMAVNRYVTATVTPHFLPMISFDLSDLAYQNGVSFSALQQLKKRIKRKYQCFLQGDFKIRDVLSKPVELAQFALTLFFDMLNVKLTQGMKISVKSDIPIGCGMGSSAATVLGVARAIAHHLHIELSPDTFFQLGLEAENMQHGFSSGLDLKVSLHGGCIYIDNNTLNLRNIPELPMYLVNTGSPLSSTGECVAAAASYFNRTQIGDDFAAITQAMDLALQNNKITQVADAIRMNHQLLVKIGVVPERVQQFIQEIELSGGAAKICGAGSIAGNQAGVVLVVVEDEALLQTLCGRYQYSLVPIRGEPRGVHVI